MISHFLFKVGIREVNYFKKIIDDLLYIIIVNEQFNFQKRWIVYGFNNVQCISIAEP